MKQVLSLKDIQEMTRNGPAAIPAEALLTPSARDYLLDMELGKRPRLVGDGAPVSAPAAPSRPPAPAPLGPPPKLTSKSPKAELEAYFRSPHCQRLKEQLCDMGRRLWQRAYVDGNGGNMAARVGEDIAVCTPTLVSKGFMRPEDMCMVDFEGKQLCGEKKNTSEILMHVQIMARQPRAIATVHCHPPYSTGFAVAGMVPPTCMIPEYEVFSSVAVAPYRTPGTPEMGKLVADLVDKHNTILMANHGVVSWSHQGLEDAYFKMEILEAYCRTILVTAQLGVPPQTMTPPQLQDLLNIKQKLGIPDPRHGLKECELCDNDQWRPGVQCAAPGPAPAACGCAHGGADTDAETAVQAITDQIMAAIKKETRP